MTIIEIVTWRDVEWSTANLVGFEVEATDGKIGKVDEHARHPVAGFIVVDTGPWIFGKKVMLRPIVQSVELDEEKVYVNRTKDEIKSAPSSTRIRSATAMPRLSELVLRRLDGPHDADACSGPAVFAAGPLD